jgi:DNA mismatch repair protein MutS
LICKNYSEHLEILENHQAILEQYAQEQEILYGFPIKYGSNNLQGFFLEITKAFSSKVPDHFRRIQTLKHCERYQTLDLQAIEQKIFTARDALSQDQDQLWKKCLEELACYESELRTLAQHISFIDLTQSLSFAGQRTGYIRPDWSEDLGIHIEQGRHPVLELGTYQFIANDCMLNHAERLWILTGPNMGGKSTYMRQVALIVFMAHIGSWVPAKKMKIGPIDHIFTRIGAHDHLSQGQSTFMVELTETARILRQCTERSLVLIDEMGRGTSTYDGLALAQATAEYLCEYSKALCLFSTHYHELQTLASQHNGIENYCFQGTICEKNIRFSYVLSQGAIEESFGLYVAQKAGLPSKLLERAWDIHQELGEDSRTQKNESTRLKNDPMIYEDHPLDWDLESFSPKDLWLRLHQWQASNLRKRN